MVFSHVTTRSIQNHSNRGFFPWIFLGCFSCSIGFSCGFPMVFPWPQDGPEQRHQRHGGGTLHHEPSIGGAHRGSAARGARLRRMGWWKIWWILNGKWWFNGDYIYIYKYYILYIYIYYYIYIIYIIYILYYMGYMVISGKLVPFVPSIWFGISMS